MTRCLIVDDEKSIRLTLSEFLKEAGYEVLTAEFADQAVELMHASPVDIVITDIILPRINGIQLMGRIRSRFPGVKLIMITGEPTIESAAEAVRAGAFDYLAKPVSQTAICKVVAAAAALKEAEDAKARLEEENRKYQVHLEDLVQERTLQIYRKEAYYRALIDNAPDMILVMDATGNLTYASPSFRRILGYEEKDLLNRSTFDFVHPEDQDAIRKALKTFLETHDSPTSIIHRGLRSDGTWLWLETTATNLLENPDVRGIVVNSQDITEKKKAQKALVESERKYRTHFENANDVVYSIDPQGVIRTLSPSVKRLLGYEVEELLGKPFVELNLLTPESLERAIRDFMRIHSGETIDLAEYTFITKDGRERIGEVSGAPLYENGKIVANISVARDISERKSAEEEKARLEAQLAQAQKMEAIGRLAGGLAHDFNNLLTGIQGYAEMIQQTLKTGDPLLGDLEEIQKATDRASALTQQLLAFSRKQTVEPRVVQLNDLIANSEKMISRLIGEDIDFIFKPGPNIESIKADPNQIDQILFNLAVNARDAMPEGGKLIVETGEKDFDAESVAGNPDLKPGNYVMLLVSDTGFGMDPETKKHIFEPFFTTKSIGKGTGLGLSTVYGIVRQNNGAIGVYSEKNLGTTFKIYLPAVHEAETAPQAKQKVEPRGGKETILLVEDEEMVLNLARKILTRSGYRVLEAGRGGDAYFLCEKHKDEIHLLLTDVIMPNMNGKELYEKLLTLKPGLKALFMSGYTEDIIAQSGVVEQGTHFIRKPFTIKELTAKVREVLDS